MRDDQPFKLRRIFPSWILESVMKVYFVSAEPEEQEFFAERLAPWEPRFVRTLEDVPEDAEVLSVFLYDAVTEEFLAKHPGLRFIATRTSGTDHIDCAACARRGIEVASVQGHDGNSVAEHTFALLLAVARRLRDSSEVRRQGGFSHAELRGFELRGKTLGLVGVGRVGARVAELATAFGMRVLAFDPSPNASSARRLGFKYVDFDTLLAESEILSLHASLTPATRHLLDAAALAKCREGVVIINTARGPLIETTALVEAIKSGQVGGVGLDVLEDERVLRTEAKSILSSEIAERVHRTGRDATGANAERKQQIAQVFFNNALLARPEVVFTPHIAFNTNEAFEALAVTTAKNLEDFLSRADVAKNDGMSAKQRWLVKQEPETYSWDDFVREGGTAWTGVRNFQARINLRAMAKGDEVLFYHSGGEKAVVGLAKVARAAYPDPTAGEGEWVCVDLAPVRAFKKRVPLSEVKARASLKDVALVRQSRLSVMPLKEAEFRELVEMGK
jgi:D-lactate dehydrogenase